MKEHKVEKQIKALLESRNMSPSKRVWEQIEGQLPSKPFNKRKIYALSLSIAGVLLLFIGLRFSFQKRTVENLIPTPLPVVTQPAPLKKQSESQESVAENTREIQSTLQLPFKSSGIAFSFVPTITPLHSSHFNRLSVPSSPKKMIFQDSLLQLETEALLEIAYENLKTSKLKNKIQKIKALELLVSVEEEIYSEIQLKTKIIDFIRSGYSKVSVATNENKP